LQACYPAPFDELGEQSATLTQTSTNWGNRVGNLN